MRNNFLAAGLAGIVLALATPAPAQQGPAPEATVDVTAIPGVVSGDAQWS